MARAEKNRSIDSQIDALYGAAPEDFIAMRDRLAKQLRDDGDFEDAKRVKSLRRPTVPAWVVNQVVRNHPREIEELLAAGEELRRAQQRALSGKGAGGLRETGERRRRALQDVMHAAEALLAESGRSSAGHNDAIRATFEAASLDRDAGTHVKEGRLRKELDAPAGFGDVAGLTLVAAAEGADEKGATKRAEQAARRRAREKREAEQARAQVAELRREADRAEREAAKAEREADRARLEAIRLRKIAERARQKAHRYSRA
ncbi:MAG: hypothetical protein M3N24_05915 [Actinomycetota bacterium]|nr:hypothetical protein [Actinomycetota bacterium]